MTDAAATRRAARHPALGSLPRGWRIVQARRRLGFVTQAVLERPDGERLTWESRRHRKGLGLVAARAGGGGRLGVRGAAASAWWMGALFGVGSVCFALGSLPPYFDTVSPSAVALTFFVGSIFFTAAATIQYREAAQSPLGVDERATRGPLRRLFFPADGVRRIDWWASAVQWVGTLFFNVSTFAATRADLSAEQAKRLIWAPDVAGSICFLVASWLAYAEVNAGWLPRPDRSIGWVIAFVNLFGSIAFGIAAVAARYLPTTGDVANIRLVNLGTFAGAIGFLVGAVLLPIESARDRSVANA